MKKKILIVDDEPDIVSYLEMVLQDQGYETSTAGNGNEALEAVRADRPDLVTLDITMPEASGTRFYKEIRTDPELVQHSGHHRHGRHRPRRGQVSPTRSSSVTASWCRHRRPIFPNPLIGKPSSRR